MPLVALGESALAVISHAFDGLYMTDGTQGSTLQAAGIEYFEPIRVDRDRLCIAVLDGTAAKLLTVGADAAVTDIAPLPGLPESLGIGATESVLAIRDSVQLDRWEVWATDCTESGTRPLVTFPESSQIAVGPVVNGAAWVWAETHPFSLHRIDLTGGGVSCVASWTAPIAGPGGVTARLGEALVGNLMLFRTADDEHGHELWGLDVRLLFADGFESGTLEGWSSAPR